LPLTYLLSEIFIFSSATGRISTICIECNLLTVHSFNTQVGNFRAFYQKHRDRLFAYLMRSTGDYYLAGDILQESFTRYLEKYGKRGPNPALLYTIARNAVVDGYRKQGRDNPLIDEPEHLQANPETQMLVREDYRRVLAAMQELAPEERDALALAVSSDLSYREIARITGTSEGNVKIRVHRARVKLRKMMKPGEK
jgi:RNA polymerase sigma-70 factor (ECF subfamily)